MLRSSVNKKKTKKKRKNNTGMFGYRQVQSTIINNDNSLFNNIDSTVKITQ
ncbi:hypothetical protein WH47_02567 [Habropoda laboriosa]|uniref:Uncharacterized protein n=1 Tax=Habropoda laboriosa TaxID=597456 RepID=A0A0L7QWF6_9HYME|nr:hypothetical protein WH47_02567 [Habropoda laboriosa]